MDAWERLTAGLAGLQGHSAPPEGGRLGAALVLLRDPGDGDLEFVFTRRRDDLRSHPGQISFPGGRIDEGETVVEAAVREAVEEVALDPAGIRILGALPAFYIPPSRFWLHAVLARWDLSHDLHPAEAEVAEVVYTRVSTLRDPDTWRTVELSNGGHTWAWQLDERHLLWGATAIVTAVVLGLIDPDWSKGVTPDVLPDDRRVRPWEGAPGPRPQPARLRDVGELALADVAMMSRDGRVAPSELQAVEAGRALAEAVVRLFPESGPPPRPLILLGPAGSGVAGAWAARALADAGVAPIVVLSGRLPEAAQVPLAGLPLERFSGVLPPSDVVVDALLGSGIDGPLRDGVREVVLALRHHSVPVISLDLPTGVDPEIGLIGEAITADITVVIGGPRPGVLRAGLEPFVGDLYLAGPDTPALLRLVRDTGSAWAE